MDQLGSGNHLLDPVWDAMVRTIGVDTLGHPLLFVAAVMTTVVVAGVAFSVVDVFVTHRLAFGSAAKYLAITLPGYVLVFVLLRWLPIGFRFDVPKRAPTTLAFVGGFAVCMVVGDVASYWWHRLEHGSRFVFHNVHYVHHSVELPLTVWSGFYVHPVESMTVFTTFYIFPFVMAVHPLTFVFYAAVNTFITMVTHCGYDLPLYPNSLLASTPMHVPHHADPVPSNFSVLLNFSDRLFGTYKPFAPATAPVRGSAR
jgi:sterol desaturase/sphingolipid hydroxylase (fatty acid hydroxylase superfamily)